MRLPDSQKNPSGQPGIDTWIGFPNLKMPSKHGLQCAPYQGRSLAPLESRCCTEVQCTPATTQRPQLSFKSTQISRCKKDKDSWKDL